MIYCFHCEVINLVVKSIAKRLNWAIFVQQYLALATDFDGTLATDGKVDAATLEAVVNLRESGRKIILITGRHLDDLLTVFPAIEQCDRVVAENGALLYTPATQDVKHLGEAPSKAFVAALKARGLSRWTWERELSRRGNPTPRRWKM
jgi:hydroxymethylpyrimidine pyrophosphatase-like HAD family hydrolase